MELEQMELNNNNNTITDIIEKVRKNIEEEINILIKPFLELRNYLFLIAMILVLNITYTTTPKLLTYNKIEYNKNDNGTGTISAGQ